MPNYFDLSFKERKKIINNAVEEANKEQANLVKKYMNKIFRAWDEQNNCWFKQENAQGNPLNKHYLSLDGFLWKVENINSGNNDSLSRKEFTIQQYTGLDDKNGTKIFGGDILRGNIVDSDIKFNNLVVENLSGLKFEIWNLLNTSFDLYDVGECEVIGNIKENPELIK